MRTFFCIAGPVFMRMCHIPRPADMRIQEMIAEVLTKRVLLVVYDLLASTPLILQRQKRMISLQHHAFRLREAKADRCKQIVKRLSISVIISIQTHKTCASRSDAHLQSTSSPSK